MVVNCEEIAPIPLPFNTHCFPVCDSAYFITYILYLLFPGTILENTEVYDEATNEFPDSCMEGSLDLIDPLLSLSPASFATSPQDVKLEYDAGTQMLTVTITHPSSFPSYHYIKNVSVTKNGADVMKNTYESQPDTDTFSYTYKVPAAEGETLEVTATCSLYGYKTVNMTVGKK